MSVLGIVAWSAAAVSLWLGAARSGARGYRWLAAAAALEAGGLVLARVLGGALSLPSGLSFADLPPLLALAGATAGIAVLAGGTTPLIPPAAPWHGGRPLSSRPGGSAPRTPWAPPAARAGASRAAVSPLAAVADGYVTAVALLVIGWVTMFGVEFHRSGDRPETFLATLIHPLADLAVLGALLPVASTAWRRVALPYLALLALAVGDALAVGQRVFGGHPGVAAQLMPVAAALLAGAAPWVPARNVGEGATAVPASATVIAVFAASAAALVVMVNGVAGAPVSAGALVVAGGAGVLVLAARAFMLVRDNGVLLRTWRRSAASLRDLADRTSDAVVVCDLGGVICYAGQAVQDYGYQPGALAGRRLLELVHPGDRGAAVAAARLGLADDAVAARAASAAGSSVGRVPVRVRAADGTWRHVEASVLRYRAPGEPARMLVTARDISDQVALRQQVTYLTFHDGLTGLPNRAYVEERARAVLRDGAVSRAGVIFLDLDRFTAVNDSAGHGAGDLVLAQAARRLRAIAPPQHTVARWGSDEFAVLVENAPSAQEVTEIAGRLADAICAEPFRVSGQQIALTASAGVAIANVDHLAHLDHLDHSGEPGAVLRAADVAMSRAKEAGGDRVEVYAAHMHADTARRREIVSDLRRAIAGGELSLAYQPIVDLGTSRVTGAEALVRWRRGLPDARAQESTDLLGVAEESGLIVPLGDRVLRDACAQGAAWRRSWPELGVSVNLSARQVIAPGFPDRLAAILAETGLPPQALTVEVDERTLITDGALVTERLAGLRRAGVRLAIDNFGTGYASLACLRQLPLDIVKIDPSFVAGLGRDDSFTVLTEAVVRAGGALGLQVIAEGIEEPRQLAVLRDMGCRHGQGYLLAAPTAAPGMTALMGTPGINVSECETTRATG